MQTMETVGARIIGAPCTGIGEVSFLSHSFFETGGWDLLPIRIGDQGSDPENAILTVKFQLQ